MSYQINKLCKAIKKFEIPPYSSVIFADFIPHDLKILITVSKDGEVRLWDFEIDEVNNNLVPEILTKFHIVNQSKGAIEVKKSVLLSYKMYDKNLFALIWMEALTFEDKYLTRARIVSVDMINPFNIEASWPTTIIDGNADFTFIPVHNYGIWIIMSNIVNFYDIMNSKSYSIKIPDYDYTLSRNNSGSFDNIGFPRYMSCKKSSNSLDQLRLKVSLRKRLNVIICLNYSNGDFFVENKSNFNNNNIETVLTSTNFDSYNDNETKKISIPLDLYFPKQKQISPEDFQDNSNFLSTFSSNSSSSSVTESQNPFILYTNNIDPFDILKLVSDPNLIELMILKENKLYENFEILNHQENTTKINLFQNICEQLLIDKPESLCPVILCIEAICWDSIERKIIHEPHQIFPRNNPSSLHNFTDVDSVDHESDLDEGNDTWRDVHGLESEDSLDDDRLNSLNNLSTEEDSQIQYYKNLYSYYPKNFLMEYIYHSIFYIGNGANFELINQMRKILGEDEIVMNNYMVENDNENSEHNICV